MVGDRAFVVVVVDGGGGGGGMRGEEQRAFYTFTRGGRGCVLERRRCGCNGDTCACGAGVHTLGSHVGEPEQALTSAHFRSNARMFVQP